MNMNDCAVIVLASGLSQRFGEQNKLLSPVNDRPLASYVARLIGEAGFRTAIAVTPPGEPELAAIFQAQQFRIVENPFPENGLGVSISMGVHALKNAAAEGAFLLLADMPCVTGQTLRRLYERPPTADAAICESDKLTSPPGFFPAKSFSRLSTLDGQDGAKSLMRNLASVHQIQVSPEELFDVDTPGDIARAEKVLTGRANLK